MYESLNTGGSKLVIQEIYGFFLLVMIVYGICQVLKFMIL